MRSFTVFFLQFLVVIFSMVAGAFWMASAYGRTVVIFGESLLFCRPASRRIRLNGTGVLLPVLSSPLSLRLRRLSRALPGMATSPTW